MLGFLNMDSIIFILCKSTDESGRSSWSDARNNVQNMKLPTKDVEESSEGIYLFPENAPLNNLGILISAAEDARCPYKVFIIRDSIQWGRRF